MSIIVGKHQEDITLNPLDWLLDAPNGNVMEFETEAKAKEYLRAQGFTDEQMEWLVFKDTDAKEE